MAQSKIKQFQGFNDGSAIVLLEDGRWFAMMLKSTFDPNSYIPVPPVFEWTELPHPPE